MPGAELAERPPFLQVFLAEGGARRPCWSSDGDPHRVHLLLESQQAVGDALLVAGQPYPNLLDVTVGGKERGRVRGWERWAAAGGGAEVRGEKKEGPWGSGGAEA